jgi:hypothetical protein
MILLSHADMVPAEPADLERATSFHLDPIQRA